LIFVAQPPELPPAALQSLGKDNRPIFHAGPSTRTGPPIELIFAERGAWGRYTELTAHVCKQKFPLWRHSEWHLNPWIFTLYQLAWQGEEVSFRAPYKLIRLFPGGSVLTACGKPDEVWPLMAQLEQAQGLSGNLAEVYCCQLVDVWAASLEALDVWGKRVTGPGNDQEGERTAQARRKRYETRKEQELAEEWERARDAGISKKDFAKDKGMSVKNLNGILSRVRMRRNRANR
jgi:hypothetical protein